MTDQDAYEALWTQSQACADWEIPFGEDAPCESSAEGRAAVASEDCIALYEDLDQESDNT